MLASAVSTLNSTALMVRESGLSIIVNTKESPDVPETTWLELWNTYCVAPINGVMTHTQAAFCNLVEFEMDLENQELESSGMLGKVAIVVGTGLLVGFVLNKVRNYTSTTSPTAIEARENAANQQ